MACDRDFCSCDPSCPRVARLLLPPFAPFLVCAFLLHCLSPPRAGPVVLLGRGVRPPRLILPAPHRLAGCAFRCALFCPRVSPCARLVRLVHRSRQVREMRDQPDALEPKPAPHDCRSFPCDQSIATAGASEGRLLMARPQLGDIATRFSDSSPTEEAPRRPRMERAARTNTANRTSAMQSAKATMPIKVRASLWTHRASTRITQTDLSATCPPRRATPPRHSICSSFRTPSACIR